MNSAQMMDEWGPRAFGVAAVLGVLVAEALYWTNAEEVRLLFVLLLVPAGAIGGMLALALLIAAVYLLAIAGSAAPFLNAARKLE